MTKGVTAPIVAVGAASVSAFNEVDSAFDTIIKKTGATGETADGLKDVFNSVASSVPADMQDVGTAIGEISTRLGLTGDELQSASEQFLKFADLNDTDVESAIISVTRAMGDAGIEASEYSSVLDELNVASQTSGIGVDTLSQNLAKYGAPMRALGIDTENAIALFSGWEKAGVNTEIAFSGMKKAISNWGKEGKDSTKEFQKAMDAIKEAPDIASATSLAIETFGAKAGPDLADAIRGGRFEIDEYLTAIENAGGSVNSTFNETQDPADKFKEIMNSVKVALSDLGVVLMDAAGPVLDQVAEKVKQATEWFRSLDDTTKQNIVKFGLMAAAAGPVVSVLGKVVTGAGGAITTFGKVSGSIFKLTNGAAKLTQPLKLSQLAFGKVGGSVSGLLPKIASLLKNFLRFSPAIAGVAAAGALVYRNFDRIKSAAGKMADGIKKAATNSGINFDGLATRFNTIKDKISGIVDRLKPIFGKIGDFLKPVMNFIDNTFVAGVEAAFEAIENTVSGVFDAIGGIFDGFETVLDGIILVLEGKFTEGFSNVFNGIGKIITSAMSGIVEVVKTPLNAIIALVNKAIGAINSISIDIPSGVPVVGGQHIGFNIPSIPMLYEGTDNWKGGTAIINEPQYGGEIVDLPSGTRVYPHDESVRKAKQDGQKSITINIPKLADSISVREDADINKIAEQLASKLVQASLNMA